MFQAHITYDWNFNTVLAPRMIPILVICRISQFFITRSKLKPI